MWKGGRDADARAALVAADAFRAGAPAENPVARALLEVLFAPVLKAARGESDRPETEEQSEGSSLLVEP